MARKDRKKKKGKQQEPDEEIKKGSADKEVDEDEEEMKETEEEMKEDGSLVDKTDDVEKVSGDDDLGKKEEVKKEEEKVDAKPTKKTTHPEELSNQVASLSGMMSELVTGMTAIARRVERMETGGANEFRYHTKPEDIAKAAAGRVGIDDRIIKLVDNILGEDFGIDLTRIDDNSLGLMFTLNVPQRLSDIKEDMRPVKDPVTGEIMLDEKKQEMHEKYWPGDKRSRAIPTGSSFDLIREHCERVRAYIVATYQKTNRPTPEFRIKN